MLYLGSKGVIPSVAVLKKGQPRVNAFREKKRFDASGPVVAANAQVADEDDEEQLDPAKLKDMEG